MGATWTTVETATRPINGNEYEHEELEPGEGRHFRLFGKAGTPYGLASDVVQDWAGNSKYPGKVVGAESQARGG